MYELCSENSFFTHGCVSVSVFHQSENRDNRRFLNHSVHIILYLNKGQVTAMLSLCHRVTWSHCHTVKLPCGHTVTRSHCHMVTLSHGHVVTWSHCHMVTLSHGHMVTLSHCQACLKPLSDVLVQCGGEHTPKAQKSLLITEHR